MLYLFFVFVYNIHRREFQPVISIITHNFLKVKEIGIIKMKICAIICEYNPFHNGHLYQLQEAKRLSGADAILCLMSGNFVQRGETAIMDKYTRARHAVLAGADIVIELPTIFATSNAELFAKGALHLLSEIPEVSSLCFGCENAEKELLLKTAALLNNEPQTVSAKIKELTATGMSYAKARADAWSDLIPNNLLISPNNILGLEYTKAILQNNLPIEIIPIQRQGGQYSDTTLQSNFSSASAIRHSIENGTNVDGNLPAFVKEDLPKSLEKTLDCLEKYAVLTKDCTQLKQICDCTEGLENAFKKAAVCPATFEESLTSARYTASRIRRIALHSLLNITENLIRESLSIPLYFRVLSANKEATEMLSILNNTNAKLIARAHDDEKLEGTAKRCYDVDCLAEKIHLLLYPNNSDKKIFI
jgi:predicted nucleotidyltransferase